MPLVQDENGVYSFVMPQAMEPEAPAEQGQQPGLDAVVEAAQPVVEELTEAAAEDAVAVDEVTDAAVVVVAEVHEVVVTDAVVGVATDAEGSVAPVPITAIITKRTTRETKFG